MQSGRFRPLAEAHGPFASVVIDDSHDTADADKQLELRWRAVEEELAAGGADEDLIASVRRGVTDTPNAVPTTVAGRSLHEDFCAEHAKEVCKYP